MKLREAPILDAVLSALKRLPHVYAWRQQVGTFLAVSGDPREFARALDTLRRAAVAVRVVTIGDDGAADVLAIVGDQRCPACGAGVHPRPVAIEVKSADGRQRAAQKTWQVHVWERRGGRYAVARSAVEAVSAVEV